MSHDNPKTGISQFQIGLSQFQTGISQLKKRQKTMAHTPNPTREEIEALERELHEKRSRAVRTAVNPSREYAG